MITAKEMSRSAGIKLEAISHQRQSDGEPVDENEKSIREIVHWVWYTRFEAPFRVLLPS